MLFERELDVLAEGASLEIRAAHEDERTLRRCDPLMNQLGDLRPPATATDERFERAPLLCR